MKGRKVTDLPILNRFAAMLVLGIGLLWTVPVAGQCGTNPPATPPFNCNKTLIYTTNVIWDNSNTNLAISYLLNIYDATTGVPTLVKSISTPTLSSYLPFDVSLPMSISEDNHYLAFLTGSYYDHNGTNFDLNLLDTKTNTLLWSKNTGLCFPTGVVVRNNNIYVVNGGTATWTTNKVDTSSSATCTGITSPSTGSGVNVYDLSGKPETNPINPNGFDLPVHPVGIAAGLTDQGQTYIYVVDAASFDTTGNGHLDTIDTSNNTIISSVAVGDNPSGVVVSPDWTGSLPTDNVFVVNGGHFNPVTQKVTGESIQAAVTSVSGSDIVTPIAPSSTSYIFNANSDISVDRPISVANSYTLTASSNPNAPPQVTPILFVADPTSQNIYAFNVSGNNVVAATAPSVQGGPAIATTSEGAYLYQMSFGGSSRFTIGGLTPPPGDPTYFSANGGEGIAVSQSPVCTLPTSQAGTIMYNVSPTCTGNFLNHNSGSEDSFQFSWNDPDPDLPSNFNGVNEYPNGSFSMSLSGAEHEYGEPANVTGISLAGTDSNGASSSIFVPISLGATTVTINNKIAQYVVNQTPAVPAFTATVAPADDKTIIWSVSAAPGSSVTGSIDSSGNYTVTPPIQNPAVSPSTVTVTATWNYPSEIVVPKTQSAANNLSSVPSAVTGTDQFSISAPYLSPPALLDFGSQQVAKSSVQPVALQNLGNATLHFDAPQTLSGDGEFSLNGFTLTGAQTATVCGSTLAAGASCNIYVQFTPTSGGSKTASMTVVSDHAGTPLPPITIQGVGLGNPTATLSAMSLPFPSVSVGAQASLPLTLSNTGNAPLTVSSIATAAPFSESDNCGTSPGNSFPGTVQPGSSCTITVLYSPTATGPTGNIALTISDNALPATQMVTLSGTGTAPSVIISPNPLSFGNVPQNTTQTSTVTVTNSGTATLNFTSVTISPGTDFALGMNSCTAPMAPGSPPCTIQINFTPSGPGARPAATLSLVDNASITPQTISITGIGGAALIPTISVSPTSLTFGSQGPNTTSLAQTFTVTNAGTANLTLGSITPSSSFKATSACPASLAPNQSCMISIVFAPTTSTPGTISGSLSIVSNDSNHSPTILGLSGTVASVSITLTPTAQNVLTGGTITFVATVLNGGSSGATWTVSGTGCAGHACGSISSTGIYTAPSQLPSASPQVDTVTATAVADTTKSASAQVTISLANPVSVTVTPPSATVALGGTTQFTAQVQSVSNQTATWSVNGVTGGNSTVGTISGSGLYTAPLSLPNPAVLTITATAVADPTKSTSALETLNSPVVVSLSPTSAPTVDLQIGQTKQFTASVLNTTNTSVTWTVRGTGCSGQPCGQISSSGLYTAPSSLSGPVTDTVLATSVADPTKSASQNVLDYLLPQISFAQGSSLTQTITAGQTITFYLTIKGGTGDPNAVLTIQCDTRYLPAGTTCSTATLTPYGTSIIFPITIITTAPPAMAYSPQGHHRAIELGLLFPFVGLVFLSKRRSGPAASIGPFLVLSIAALIMAGCIGCGTSGSFNPTAPKTFTTTPIGSFTIPLNGALPGAAQQFIANLTLIVQ